MVKNPLAALTAKAPEDIHSGAFLLHHVKNRPKHFADYKIIPTFAHTITHGSLAEWLGTGLQNRLQQFDSARNLKTFYTATCGRFFISGRHGTTARSYVIQGHVGLCHALPRKQAIHELTRSRRYGTTASAVVASGGGYLGDRLNLSPSMTSGWTSACS